jgi:hypothetical protein
MEKKTNDEIADSFRDPSKFLPKTESNKQSWEKDVPKSNHVIPVP